MKPLTNLEGIMRTSIFFPCTIPLVVVIGCHPHTSGGTGGQGGSSASSSATSAGSGGQGATGGAGGSSSAGGMGGAGGAGGGDLVWAKAFPGCAGINGLGTDAPGQITIGGNLPGGCTMSFGPVILNGSAQYTNGYWASFDPIGKPLW